MDIKQDWLLWFINFLIKSQKEVGQLIIIINKICNQQKNYINQNIWCADLADMQLIRKFNKGFRFFLCVIEIFSKYAWVVPLKDKKGVNIVNENFKRI